EWHGARLVLVPFAVLGLFAMSASVWFALACSFALFAGYLTYGHWAHWTLYYLEGLPVLSVIAAFGIWNAVEHIRRRLARESFESGTRVLMMIAAALALLAGYEALVWRANHQRNATWDVAFHQLLDRVTVRSAVIFVHYAPRLGPHLNVVANSPHLLADS